MTGDALAAACAAILATNLPADASPLLIERHAVVRRLAEALSTCGMLQAALVVAKTDQDRANLQRLIDEGKAECERLGDRLLQIAASPGASAAKQ